MEAFLSEFSGLLLSNLPDTSKLRVHTWPLEGTTDLVLGAEMDHVHWSYRICPDHIQARSPTWRAAYLYGLVLMATAEASRP